LQSFIAEGLGGNDNDEDPSPRRKVRRKSVGPKGKKNPYPGLSTRKAALSGSARSLGRLIIEDDSDEEGEVELDT